MCDPVRKVWHAIERAIDDIEQSIHEARWELGTQEEVDLQAPSRDQPKTEQFDEDERERLYRLKHSHLDHYLAFLEATTPGK